MLIFEKKSNTFYQTAIFDLRLKNVASKSHFWFSAVISNHFMFERKYPFFLIFQLLFKNRLLMQYFIKILENHTYWCMEKDNMNNLSVIKSRLIWYSLRHCQSNIDNQIFYIFSLILNLLAIMPKTQTWESF